MSKEKALGLIKIIEIKVNDNGTCTINYEVPEDLKTYFKNYFGWKRWSSKKFNEFFLEALMKNAKTLERESGSNTAVAEHSPNVSDDKSF
jgi:hypothetical protein